MRLSRFNQYLVLPATFTDNHWMLRCSLLVKRQNEILNWKYPYLKPFKENCFRSVKTFFVCATTSHAGATTFLVKFAKYEEFSCHNRLLQKRWLPFLIYLPMFSFWCFRFHFLFRFTNFINNNYYRRTLSISTLPDFLLLELLSTTLTNFDKFPENRISL